MSSRNKTRFDQIPAEAMEQLGQAFTEGLLKYGDSWKSEDAELDLMDLFGAIQRHGWSWKNGRSEDEESGLHPMAHIACSAMMILAMEKRGWGQDSREPPVETVDVRERFDDLTESSGFSSIHPRACPRCGRIDPTIEHLSSKNTKPGTIVDTPPDVYPVGTTQLEHKYQVVCSCEVKGPPRPTSRSAIRAWNHEKLCEEDDRSDSDQSSNDKMDFTEARKALRNGHDVVGFNKRSGEWKVLEYADDTVFVQGHTPREPISPEAYDGFFLIEYVI